MTLDKSGQPCIKIPRYPQIPSAEGCPLMPAAFPRGYKNCFAPKEQHFALCVACSVSVGCAKPAYIDDSA